MLPVGQRWHLVVLVLVPATPIPWEKSSSHRTTRFSLQSRLERWTPLLQQQAPKYKPKCQYWQNRKGSVLTPSKILFFKEERVQQLILDSLIFLTTFLKHLLWARHWGHSNSNNQKSSRVPALRHSHSTEMLADTLVCCSQITVWSSRSAAWCSCRKQVRAGVRV